MPSLINFSLSLTFLHFKTLALMLLVKLVFLFRNKLSSEMSYVEKGDHQYFHPLFAIKTSSTPKNVITERCIMRKHQSGFNFQTLSPIPLPENILTAWECEEVSLLFMQKPCGFFNERHSYKIVFESHLKYRKRKTRLRRRIVACVPFSGRSIN